MDCRNLSFPKTSNPMCKKLFAGGALWFMLLLLPTMLLAQGPGFTAYKKGEQYRRQQNYEQALQQYEEAIRLEDNNYRYYARKALVEIKLKKFDAAIRSFENATRVNPGWTSGFLYLAKLSMRSKDYASAVRYMNQAYDNERDQAKKLRYKLLTVKLLLKTEQPQRAMSELQKAKSLAPDDARVLGTEGDVQTELGNHQAAIASYQGALNRLPGDAPAKQKVKYHIGLAVAHYKSGNKQKADQIATENIKPVSTRAYRLYKYKTQGSGAAKYLALARGYMKANAFSEAMENVNKAIEAGDKNAISYKFQGLIYYKQGQMQQAIMAFTRSAEAEEDEKKKAKLYGMMVKLQFNSQLYREALQTADAYLQTDPNNAQILLYKAQSQYQLGQYQAAISTAEQGMSQVDGKPRQAVYQFVIGLAAKKAGNTERAAEAFKAAQMGPFKYAAREEARSLSVR